MKQIYKIVLVLCIIASPTTQAQTFEFSLSFIGTNASTGNYQIALIATPSSSVTNGITTDMGAGLYIPSGLTIGNFVQGDSGLPAGEWTSQTLGASNANGDPYFLSRVEAGSSSVILNGSNPFQLVLFDIIADPNPTSENISFVENGDPIFNEILFIQNYINIDLGTGFTDAYNQNDPVASSIDFSTLSTEEETFKDINISIYPNPVIDIINIKGLTNEISKVEIYNINGQHILTKKTNMETVNIKEFNSGLYFIKLYTATASKTIKLIKN